MRVLVTGEADSGKSAFAEGLAVEFPEPRYYIATMKPFDEEGLARIAKHREMRKGKGFVTIEQYADIDAVDLADDAVVLLECLCNLVSNEMFDAGGNIDEAASGRVLGDVLSLAERCENIIVVAADYEKKAGYDDGTRRYIETLDGLKANLSARFDRVYHVTEGEAVRVK
jgi:adenosylcobinamide kinase/adenosylcobinamide-phosphate guanylyltransferase